MKYFLCLCFFLSGIVNADFHIQACKDSFNQQNSKLKRIIKANPKLKDLDTFDPKGILRNFLETSRVELGLRHIKVDQKTADQLRFIERYVIKHLISPLSEFQERIVQAKSKKNPTKEELELAKIPLNFTKLPRFKMKKFGYWKNLFSLKLPFEVAREFARANENMVDLPTYQAELKRFPVLNVFLYNRPDNDLNTKLWQGFKNFFHYEFQGYKPSLKEIVRTSPLFKDLDIIDRRGIIRNFFETSHVRALLKKTKGIDKVTAEKLIHMEKLIKKHLITKRVLFLERLNKAYDNKKDGKASKEDLEFLKVYNGFHSSIREAIQKLGDWEAVFSLKLPFELSREYARSHEAMLTTETYQKIRKSFPLLEVVLYSNPDAQFKDKGYSGSNDFFGTITVSRVAKKISNHIKTSSTRDLERTDKELEKEEGELDSKKTSDTKVSKTSLEPVKKGLSPSAKGLIEVIETFGIEGYTEHLARHPLNSYMNAKNKIEELLEFPEKGLDKVYTEYEMKKIKDAWEREEQKAFLLKEGIIID